MKRPISVYLKLIFLITLIIVELTLFFLLPTYLAKKILFFKLAFHFLGVVLFLFIISTQTAIDYKLIFAFWLFVLPEFFVFPICFFIFTNKEDITLTNMKIEKLSYYDSGESFFSALKNELNNATNFILLQFYIIKKGILWTEIYEILKTKVKQGVKIILAFDGFGGFAFSNKTVKELSDLGIKVKVINPINVLLININKRNHRKIAVIDGRIAFIGGINLGDEYINQQRRFGYWQDTAISFSGEGVNALTTCFFESINEKTIDNFLVGKGGKCDCIFYFDAPNISLSAYQDILIQNLYRAKEEVCILTPYFVPSESVEKAISFALERGVKISLLLPHIPDKKTVYLLSKYNALKLKKKGASITLCEGAFLHTKSVVFDKERVLFGSSNTDMRSMFLHYECGLLINDGNLAEKIVNNVKNEKMRSQKQIKTNYFQKLLAIIINTLYPFI